MSRDTMRAAVITAFGGPEVLEVREVPRPVPAEGEILVRVRGSALNRADLHQRRGRYPAPPGVPQDIPGLEFAGEVAKRGSGARRWREGDRVFGIGGGGAHAEYLVAHEDAVAEVPAGLAWTNAGAVPEAFITAHDAMVTQAGTRAGELVLTHAVGSGVGLAATQLARALGARPFGTSRTADKIERARALGLEDGVVVAGDDMTALQEAARRWSGGRGVDVVLDLVGGPYVRASVEALAAHGRLILIGTVAGGRGELPLGLVLGKRLTIRGTVLRARPLAEKIAVTRAFEGQVVPLLAAGTVAPVIDSVYPLERIAEAHRHLESEGTFGKVALRI